MQEIYDKIIKFIVSSGKRISKRAGKIKDIGIKKMYLTEEDLTIERGMRDIIKKCCPDHKFYAEEEHEHFPEADDIWIADPISGTKTYIEGLPHYGIAIAHTKNNIVKFGAVYDPSVDELFIAYKGKGAFLNGKKISVSKSDKKIMANISYGWKDDKSSKEVLEKLNKFQIFRNKYSFAVNLCHVACGRYDGTVCLCKDSFPLFAGSLIIQEAGGIFTNIKGDSNPHHEDRIFFGGNKETYNKLKEIIKTVNFP
jgi:myo-inositol-1(or 4)-monophosphatase